MPSPTVWNHFAFASGAFGKEDFLTASLASIMTAVPEARQAFLQWIDEIAGEGLADRNWTIELGRHFRTRDCGTAIPDMTFVCDDLELWFEHKLTAAEGTRTSTDGEKVAQLAKYQQAREIHEAHGERRRVLLFYITGKPQVVNDAEVGEIHAAGGRGFVHARSNGGALLWRDLHPKLHHALEACRAARPDEFATQLFSQLMGWWDRLPYMRAYPTSVDLHPEDPSTRSGLWPLAIRWLSERIHGRYHDYNGWLIVGEQLSGPVDLLTVEPRRPEQIAGWTVEYGTDVLRVTLRVPDLRHSREVVYLEPEGRRPVMVTQEPSKKGVMVRVHVGLRAWSEYHDDTGRQRAILAAVQTALQAFEKAYGIALVGSYD